jgi:cobalt transporter subunit CbtA
MPLIFSPAAFRELVVAALLAGFLAGLLLTAVQQIQVIPALLKAEQYQQKTTVETISHSQDHDWQPENGWERSFFTALANIGLGIGFALLTGSAMSLRGGVDNWRKGLLWGLAGYIIFFVAPSLGLPPEIPGADAAKLEDWQNWWLITVLDSGFGLWLLVFAKTRINKLFGAVLLITPHLIGAPQPEVHNSVAPVELAQVFMTASVFANAVFWLAIGGFTGLFGKKIHDQNR